MRKYIVLILFVAYGCTATIAQDSKFEGGIMLGLCNYHGDLVDSYVEFGESKFAYGLFARYKVNHEFSIKANIYGGSISGTDENSDDPSRVNRGLKFNSNLFEIGINGEWYFLSTIFNDYSKTYNKNKFFPYLFTGLNAVYFDPTVTITESNDGNVDPEPFLVSKINLAIPIGAGFKVKTGHASYIGFELGFRTAFTDYLDGVSETGNPDKNDWYMYAGATYSYFFNSDQKRKSRETPR